MKRYLLIVLVFINFNTSHAQSSVNDNFQNVIKECVQLQGNDSHSILCMVLPFNLFELKQDEGSLLIAKDLKDYLIVLAAERRKNGDGIMIGKTFDEIKNSMELFDSMGVSYHPISEDSISSKIKNFAESIRASLSKSFGTFGQDLHTYVFKLQGKLIIDAAKENRFIVTWDKIKFNWKMPFPSLLPPKFCPIDNQIMKGNWIYCPFHGTKLDK